MKKRLMILVFSIAAATLSSAQGMGGGMTGGSGMMIVADDGSLLVTNMDMRGMMGGGSVSTSTVRSSTSARTAASVGV